MKKIILSIAVLALALSSCEDFLTKEPPMDQSDELALSTFEGIDGATAGNYRAVISWLGFKSQTGVIRRIHQNRIRYLKVGRNFMIPKEYLIDYLLSD